MSLTELALAGAGILVLICLSAFFSGSETGLTAASRARINHLAQQGQRRALLVSRLLDRQERLIGTVLLGNNLVNILASSLATSVLITVFGDAGVVYATLAMTLLVLVFAEVLPKTYAINNPDRTALAVAPLISVAVAVLAPVVHAVQVLVNAVLRLFGADIKPGQSMVSAAEEIKSSLDLHGREGTLHKSARDMLGSILDLDEVEVSDVMIHRRAIEMLDLSEPTSVLINQAMQSRHSRLPLWRDDSDNIVGVLHTKDLLRELMSARAHAAEFDMDAFDLMKVAKEPWFVPDTTSLREQLHAFRTRHAHFALVVDEYGTLMGLVTLEDILEEIVGDIRDEHDSEEVVGIEADGEGGYTVAGSVTIRDLNRRLDWNLSDDEATTVAGLLIHEARRLPETGQVFVFHNVRFEVLRRQRTRVTQLRLTPLTPSNGGRGDGGGDGN
ncbi:MAG: HlyC/CorC family transporter [Sneathiellaceae bacterium]